MNIYEKAVVKWGAESQVNMVIEECSELIVTLRHHARGRASADDVCNEVADVEIMMEQMRVILGGANVELKKNEKLARLAKRVSEPVHVGDRYDHAVTLVQTVNKVSTSHLQRVLRIGYNHACHLIKRMEREDIISAPDERGRREVLYQAQAAKEEN